MKIFITGISGTGKTSITRVLKQKGFNAFDMDEHDLCSWFNKNNGEKVDYEAKLDKDFIDAHIWVCDIEKLKLILENQDFIIMLGYPENVAEILPLFDKLILLQCQPKVFLKRILEREDNDFGKDETVQRHLLETYREFENMMIKLRAITINTEGTLEEVVGRVIEEISK